MKKIIVAISLILISIGIYGQIEAPKGVKYKGVTSGSVLVKAPSVAGSNTLTLPAQTSTIATIQDLNIIKAGVFNVLDYGAHADANWSNGSGTADDDAFADAIAAATAYGGGTVYVPSGGYLITETMRIGKNIKLLCDQAATLWVPKTFSDTTIILTTNISGGVTNSSIIGAHIRPQDDGATTPTYVGIALKSTSSSYPVYLCLIRDCVVRFAGVAFDLATTNNGWINWNTFDNINAEAVVSAFKTREGGSSLGIDYNTISGLKLQVTSITKIGLDSISGNGNAFTNYQTVDWSAAPTGRSGVFYTTSRNNYVQAISDESNGFLNKGTENIVFVNTSASHGIVGDGYHLVMPHNTDPLDDVSFGRYYPLVLRNVSNTDGDGTGVAFVNSTSSEGYNIGASIIFNRTGAYSKGQLEFYTKSSTSSGDAPVKRFTIEDGYGIKQTQISAALTDNTPTDSEIDTATGLTPSTAGAGYQVTIKDNTGSGLLYRIETDGTTWFYTVMTGAL